MHSMPNLLISYKYTLSEARMLSHIHFRNESITHYMLLIMFHDKKNYECSLVRAEGLFQHETIEIIETQIN